MPDVIQSSALPGLLRPGITVFVQGGIGEPLHLIEALQAAPEASAGVQYLSCLVPGINRTDYAGLHETARLRTFFVPGDLAGSFGAGRVDFLPLHYSGICSYLEDHPPVDMALIQVSPPDADGNCSLGLSIDFVPIMFGKSGTIVAEINPSMPAPPGSLSVPYDRLDYVVECEHPLITMETGEISETMARIGANVAGLVEDGATIQLGIGQVPAAIVSRLKDRRDLGLQGGMVTDGVKELVEAGALNGARKTYEPGKMLCGMALGRQDLYDWAATRDDILFRPATVTHDVRVISQLDNFVSINSSLEIDLTGQANAEAIGGRQISGTGGLVDFVRGARMARNGRSIIALAATAARGKVSRIVPWLENHPVVSCPRADIDYVVTEHGAARLKGLGIDARAEALIAVAAPEFRNDLATSWERLRREVVAK